MSDNPKKRSLTLKGHRTSISLENAFWQALQTIAEQQSKSVTNLVEEIDEHRGDTGLSTALRLYILKYYQRKAEQ